MSSSTKAITGSVLNMSQAPKSETSLFRRVSLPVGHVITADCRDDKDTEKQFRRKNAVGNMLVRKFIFASMDAKNPIVQAILLPNLCGCSLALIVTHLNDLLISPYTSSSVASAMNTTEHITVVFHISAYRLMSRATTSIYLLLLPLSIVMHIISLY